MNKREFLDLLRYYLRSYPAHIVNDMVSDYEEHFRIGAENGKTETEIAAELGSPRDIAEEFFTHERPPRPNPMPNFGQQVPPQGGNPNIQGTPPVGSRANSSPWWIVLGILGAIFVAPPLLGVALGIVGSFVGIMLALFATTLALGVSGIVTMVSWAFPYGGIRDIVNIFGITPHPVTAVFLGIFLICLAILLCYLTALLFTVCIKGIKNLYLSIRWTIAKRRGY